LFFSCCRRIRFWYSSISVCSISPFGYK